jgi:hypothetical protein
MKRVVLVTVAVLSVALQASADFVINLNYEFSGASSPSGTAPWLRATFTDLGGADAGKVSLKLDSLLQDSDEFANLWFFNFNNNSQVAGLTFTQTASSGNFAAPAILRATSNSDASLKADGDGYFDFGFDFANGGGQNQRFGASDSVTFKISAAFALSAADFNLFSAPGGGNGSYRSAAHVQGIGSNAGGSGWIGEDGPDQGVPEAGSTLAMLGLALVGCEGVRRKLRK